MSRSNKSATISEEHIAERIVQPTVRNITLSKRWATSHRYADRAKSRRKQCMKHNEDNDELYISAVINKVHENKNSDDDWNETRRFQCGETVEMKLDTAQCSLPTKLHARLASIKRSNTNTVECSIPGSTNAD